MFPSLRTSFRLKLQLVSALALTVALQAMPANAMDVDPPETHVTQEDILTKIDEYYANPEKFMNFLEEIYSSSSSSSDAERRELPPSSAASNDFVNHANIKMLKALADKGDQKAKVLYLYAMIDNNQEKTEEWAPIHDWLITQRDDPMALTWLGEFETKEWAGHPVNMEKAEQYFLQAVEKGSLIALQPLGKMYEFGWNGRPANPGKAVAYYAQAAEKGEFWACSDLYDLYEQGWEGHPADLEKAESYYLLAVKNLKNTDKYSDKEISSLYIDEYLYSDNRCSSIPLKIAADEGNPKAKVLYFHTMLLNDESVNRDEWTAIHNWLVSQGNDLAALIWLGEFETKEWEGHPINIEQAEHYLLKAAENGSREAYKRLATLFEHGLGVIDLNKAEKYYLKLAESEGCTEPAYLTSFYHHVAQSYHYGWYNQPVNLTKAEAYYLKAAEHGSADSYKKLALFYHYGSNVQPVNLEKAEEYYLQFVKSGDPAAQGELATFYWSKGSDYHYGNNGQSKDLAKAEEFYLKAAANGYALVYISLGHLYHYGIKDFAKAEEFYLKAAERGNTSAYGSLGNLYHYGINDQSKDFVKAEEFYLKATANGDASAYNSLGNLYHYGGPNNQPIDVAKAEEFYLKAAKGGYVYAYSPLSSFAYGRKERSKAVHWAIKAKDAKQATTPETLLKDYLIPPKVENAVEEVAIISIDEEEAKGIVEQWANASTWLVPLAGKMMWKMGEFSQEGKTKTNVRSHKPSARNHYANFSATLEKANVCFSKSLANDSFSFLMPKTSVKNHLLTQFNVYNPTAPTSSDCMGLRMYNIWPYQQVIAFGNENVKLADDVAEVLTGPFSLTHLINHHRGKKTLLEQLRDHKQQKIALPQDLLQLELAILQKPRRLISFDNEAEPTLSFKDHLVEKIRLTGNDMPDEIIKRHIDHRLLGMAMALLKKAEGDKTELSKDQIAVKLKAVCGSISEETINLYIDNKMVGVSANPIFEQCINNELIQQINQKIVKRTEKVELLEGIVDTFKQMLMVAHPQKVAKFKTDYPDLSDMFD